MQIISTILDYNTCHYDVHCLCGVFNIIVGEENEKKKQF